MFTFDYYIVSKYLDDEYFVDNIFTNLNDAEDYILKQSAPYDFQVQCFTPNKPSLFITYEMEA